MSILFALISIALQIGGMFFLFAAGVGLLRFKDPLQRMHAATKAGTIGAGLILAGAVFTVDSFEGVIVGCLAILFLLLTAPVAGHLLGRAAYISGAPLVGLENTDALQGVVKRHEESARHQANPHTAATIARARSGSGSGLRPGSRSSSSDLDSDSDRAANSQRIHAIDGVRFAIIAPDETVIAQRALDIGQQHDVPVQARALIDRNVLDHCASPEKTREQIKHRLADAIGRVETRFAQAGVKLSMFYSEGDAHKWIPSQDSASVLLVLPQAGWCDHGVAPRHAMHDAKQLIRLARTHAGPCLLVGNVALSDDNAHALVMDDHSARSVDALLWALQAGLWRTTLVTLAQADSDRVAVFREALVSSGRAADVHVQTLALPGGQQATTPPNVLVGVAPLDPADDATGDRVWVDYLNTAAFKEVLMFPRKP